MTVQRYTDDAVIGIGDDLELLHSPSFDSPWRFVVATGFGISSTSKGASVDGPFALILPTLPRREVQGERAAHRP